MDLDQFLMRLDVLAAAERLPASSSLVRELLPSPMPPQTDPRADFLDPLTILTVSQLAQVCCCRILWQILCWLHLSVSFA